MPRQRKKKYLKRLDNIKLKAANNIKMPAEELKSDVPRSWCIIC